MKSIRRFLAVIIVGSIALLMQGFTFDYEILTECEKRHPNDFVARVVCNNKMEDEVREQKALRCVEEQKGKLISLHQEPLHRLLIDNGKEEVGAIQELLRVSGYNSSVVSPKSEEGTTLVFDKPIPCKTKARLLFNLRFDKAGLPKSLHGWISYPDSMKDYGSYIHELEWRRFLFKQQIDDAYKLKEIRLRQAEEELKKNQPTALDQNKQVSSIKSAEVVSQKDQNGSTAGESRLAFFGLLIMSVFGVAASVFYKRRAKRKIETKEGYVDKSAVNVLTTIKDIFPVAKESSEKVSAGHTLGDQVRRFTDLEVEAIAQFKLKHEFVHVDVPIDCMAAFVEECNWYKTRVGVYPGLAEQNQILDEIIRSRDRKR